jgi:mannose/fructose/N-acetylgalactosamine-specific phosphotransferase system component IIB
MKVWIDLLSGDEMISDSYKQQFLFNDACLEVKAKMITVKDSVQIACDGKYQASTRFVVAQNS